MIQENLSLKRSRVWHTVDGDYSIPQDLGELFSQDMTEAEIRNKIIYLFKSSKNASRTFNSIKEFLQFLNLYKYTKDKDLVLSMINSKSSVGERIGARECDLQIIKGSLQEFYDYNHIQGNTQCSFTFFLVKGAEIVQAVSIQLSNDSATIVRNATLRHFIVQGGFSKILKRIKEFLVENYSIHKIYTFANGDFSRSKDTNVYIRNNFRFLYDTGGTLWYLPKINVFIGNRLVFEKGILINRQRLMKSKLHKLNGAFTNEKGTFIYNEHATEQENLKLLGIEKYKTKACYKYVLEF